MDGFKTGFFPNPFIIFKCPCNDRDYPTQASLKSHQKTKMHMNWVASREQRELKIDMTKRDNKILALELQNSNLKELNVILIERIRDLKKLIF